MAAYAIRDDLELMWGKQNVRKWASIDNDNSDLTIAHRIAWALELASRKLDGMLGGRGYIIPFEPLEEDGDLDPEIIEMTCRLAALLLYDPRGVTDSESENGEHKLSGQADVVNKWAHRVRSGRITLNALNGVTSVAEAVLFEPL